jgi:hypothetical protein
MLAAKVWDDLPRKVQKSHAAKLSCKALKHIADHAKKSTDLLEAEIYHRCTERPCPLDLQGKTWTWIDPRKVLSDKEIIDTVNLMRYMSSHFAQYQDEPLVSLAAADLFFYVATHMKIAQKDMQSYRAVCFVLMWGAIEDAAESELKPIIARSQSGQTVVATREHQRNVLKLLNFQVVFFPSTFAMLMYGNECFPRPSLEAYSAGHFTDTQVKRMQVITRRIMESPAAFTFAPWIRAAAMAEYGFKAQGAVTATAMLKRTQIEFDVDSLFR